MSLPPLVIGDEFQRDFRIPPLGSTCRTAAAVFKGYAASERSPCGSNASTSSVSSGLLNG